MTFKKSDEDQEASRDRSSEARPEKKKNRTQGKRWPIYAAIVVALVGIGAYFAYQRDWDVRGAYRLARSASEEAATTARVKAALALSSTVSAFDIDVDTQGDMVRLRGQVPSDQVRDLAVAIAEDTSGVDSVSDELLIDPAARPSREIERLRSRVADLEIRAAIESALRRNADLKPEDITVQVKDQQVSLTGTVEDEAEKFGAERLAASTDGVKGVSNSITVASPSPQESSSSARTAEESAHQIEKRVEFELFAADAFDLERLEVRADESGAVILTGEVRSPAEKLLAARIASDVDGVESVNNQLEVLTLPHRGDS